VIGAGAAGLMAAIFAAAAARTPVILLERTKEGGRKILISGGGRCNVLPSSLSPTDFVTASSANTMRKMLLSWPLPEQRWFFEHDLGIPLVLEVASGKLFPQSNRARDVRDSLVAYATKRGATMQYSANVIGVEPIPNRLWRITLSDAPPIDASAVVLATGGLSVPATGSDGTGLRIARQLGHTVHDTYPALTPLVAEGAPHANLAGVSLNVTLRATDAKRRYEVTGGFLFTHRGYSGPAVLNISHIAVRSRLKNQPRPPILVQWCELDTPAWDDILRTQGNAQLASTLRRHVPSRVADMLIDEAHVAPDRRLSELKREERTRIVHALTRYRLPWMGDEGYKKAEVTGGGVSLGEVDPITLESRLHPGLFLCGEMLDAFGPIGGYNFAWAWATGRAAGLGAARFR
jgi:predicted Rossmann fold flavoprotein